jgi:hypothetical protein
MRFGFRDLITRVKRLLPQFFDDDLRHNLALQNAGSTQSLSISVNSAKRRRGYQPCRLQGVSGANLFVCRHRLTPGVGRHQAASRPSPSDGLAASWARLHTSSRVVVTSAVFPLSNQPVRNQCKPRDERSNPEVDIEEEIAHRTGHQRDDKPNQGVKQPFHHGHPQVAAPRYHWSAPSNVRMSVNCAPSPGSRRPSWLRCLRHRSAPPRC